ncbi:MAG: BtrH N-terminal domain-containing protein [Bacillota bacterium]
MESYIKKELKLTAGSNCLYTNISDATKYYCNDLEEYEIFFLSDGLRCSYSRSCTGIDIQLHRKVVVNNYDTIVRNYAKEINALAMIEYNSKSMTFIEVLTKAIDSDNPIILILNSKCLKYQTPPSHLVDVDAMHAIIVHGFDSKNEKIFIYDSYVYDDMQNPIPYYKSELTYETVLENAYASIWFDFGPYKQLSKEYIFNKIIHNLKSFLNMTDDEDGIIGIKAFEQCIKDMELLKSADLDEAKTEFNELFYLFKVRFSFANNYLLRFISDCQYIDSSKKEQLTKAVEALIKDWNNYLMKMLIGSCMGNEKVIDRIISSGLLLSAKQKSVMSEIVDVIGSF